MNPDPMFVVNNPKAKDAADPENAVRFTDLYARDTVYTYDQGVPSPTNPIPMMGDPVLSNSGRQSAAAAFRAKADHFRRRAARLEALAKFADTIPPGDPAEEALWTELMYPG